MSGLGHVRAPRSGVPPETGNVRPRNRDQHRNLYLDVAIRGVQPRIAVVSNQCSSLERRQLRLDLSYANTETVFRIDLVLI